MSLLLSWFCWRLAFMAGNVEALKAKLRGKPWDFDPRTIWWAAAVRFNWMADGRFMRSLRYRRECDTSTCRLWEIP